MDRKVTRKSEEKRDEALDQGLRLTIDGRVYEARVGDVTPEISRELRRGTDMGFLQLLDTLANRPDVDVISAFVWVARRIQGEYLDLDQVSISYKQFLSDGFDIALPGAESADNSPEG